MALSAIRLVISAFIFRRRNKSFYLLFANNCLEINNSLELAPREIVKNPFFLAAPILNLNYSWKCRSIDIAGRYDKPTFQKVKARGVYDCRKAELVFSDILGMASIGLKVRAEEKLIVKFGPGLCGPSRNPAGLSNFNGEGVEKTRDYIPGDDVRHIRWKHFSYSGKLITSYGDRKDPGEGIANVVIDNSLSYTPEANDRNAAELDCFLEDCIAFIEAYLNKVSHCKVYLADGSIINLNAQNRTALRTELAGLWYADAMKLNGAILKSAIVLKPSGENYSGDGN